MRGALGLVLLSALSMACEGGIPGFDPRNGTAPIMESFGVDFEAYDSLTGRAGDFIFDPSIDRPLVEFGHNNDTADGVQVARTWELRLAPGTTILAPLGAEVLDVVYRSETDDSDIVFTTRSNSAWRVIVHHVNAVVVAKGDQVSAGTAIGEAGNLNGAAGRIELQITHDDVSYCPFELLKADTDLEARVSELMADWETWAADDTVYDESAQTRPGCAATSFTEP